MAAIAAGLLGRRWPRVLSALAVAALATAALLHTFAPPRAGTPPVATVAAGAAPGAASAAVAVPAAATTGPIGWVDAPADELVVGDTLAIKGWALDPEGIRAVDVRVDGQAYPARYGLSQPDVTAVKPGFPDSARPGFAFEHTFTDLTPTRHEVEVVAIGRSGREKILGRRSLAPAAAMHLWSDLLAARPALAHQPFFFLMMTSGVTLGGANEVDSAYRGYISKTQRVGISVPILYLRTTQGAAHDWVFDPAFDLSRRCGNRLVADDNLDEVMAFSIAHRVPVQFILNGGIWGDASCATPQWDLTDHLEADDANVQWAQDNRTFPDDYLKHLAGSTESPELARSLTYNVYARTVRDYKRRNLQAAATRIAAFAREHPDLFVGVALDSDTYMNPFFQQKETFDYNPGMLRQFREWLRGTGPYAGAPAPGVPDLRAYRRARPLSLADVNRLARAHWKSWQEVDPPRRFPGSMYQPLQPGERLIWTDPWWHEWETFRKHIVDLHYDELSSWVHAVGVPRDRIFSAQGFLAPDPGLAPFAVHIDSHAQNYDSAGVSIEGSIPRDGHLGAVIYGEAARNDVRMEGRHSLFATFARMDEGWAVVEFNPADLKRPKEQPTFDMTYHALRDIFNFGAREVSVMAWNGSNGLFASDPAYVPYTAWRNTPGEDAMRDFLVSHADLPFGARLWTFGTARLADTDGWTIERGRMTPGKSHLLLRPDAGRVTLASAPDREIRPREIDTLLLALADPARLIGVRVLARTGPHASWKRLGDTPLRRAANGRVDVALLWPRDFGAGTIVEELKLELTFAPDTPSARLDRIALYPRATAR